VLRRANSVYDASPFVSAHLWRSHTSYTPPRTRQTALVTRASPASAGMSYLHKHVRTPASAFAASHPFLLTNLLVLTRTCTGVQMACVSQPHFRVDLSAGSEATGSTEALTPGITDEHIQCIGFYAVRSDQRLAVL